MRPIFSAFTALTLATAAAAQCGTWSAGFAAPSLPVMSLTGDLAVFDDGSGSALYYAGASRISRWTGSDWLPLHECAPRYAFEELKLSSNGGLPVLLAAANAPNYSGSEVWRFDGNTWTPLGTLAFRVLDLGYLDDGSGESLFAAGGTTTQGRVARWTGTAWVDVGAPFATRVLALETASFGGSPKLYAAGVANLVGSSSVAFWNGAGWSAVPGMNDTVRALRRFDPGTGERLYTGHSLLPSVLVREFDGSSWSVALTSVFGTVSELYVSDLGAGPRLVVANFGGPESLIAFDGTTATDLGAGLAAGSGSPRIWDVACFGPPAAPRLFVAGLFDAAGGVSCQGLAEWDGATWSTIGRGLFPIQDQVGTVRAFGAFDFGSGSELLVAGAFGGAGGGPTPLGGVARWNGSSWLSTSPISLSANDPSSPYALASVDFGQGPQFFAGGVWLGGQTFNGFARRTGQSWSSPIPGPFGNVFAMTRFDAPSGVQLIVGGQFAPPGPAPGNNIFAFDGTVAMPLGVGVDNIVGALAVHDDGTGSALYVGGQFDTAGGIATGRVARWDGSAWSALGSGIPDGFVHALCSFDAGSGAQLYAGGSFTDAGGIAVSSLARWNGTAWGDVPGGGVNGTILALALHDDGRGTALYAGGEFDAIGGITAYNLARFDGSTWAPVAGGVEGAVHALSSFDDDSDGVPELFVGGNFFRTASVASGRIARLAGCPHYASFCAGDGALADHTTPCPCGNNGAPGHGCASGFNANGALLGASGATQTDNVVLAGSGFPTTAFGIYLQHDALDDRVFHDGVLCAGGSLLRLRNRTASGGASQFPDPSFAVDATTTLAQRGGVTPGSGALRYYSVFYRSPAATFCPPATANVTNGVRVLW